MPADNTVLMEGVTIVFRNFSGKEGKYNREGDRNFAVVLNEETGQNMEADGWNVKWFKEREEREEGDPKEAYLPVTVGYGKGRPPNVVMITSRGRTNLSESEVEVLDWAEITNVDLIVRPYHWDVNGKQGIKAYLKSIYVTIEEDDLEKKYAELEN